jgi:hypothetical protein
MGLLFVTTGLGVLAAVGVTAAMATVVEPTATAESAPVDFTLELKAPLHVAAGSAYVVNIIYYNLGTETTPEAWVTATLPAGTAFVTATDRWGEPLPPDGINGNALTWHLTGLNCHKPADACCGHIFLTLQVDETLPEGEVLTTTATIATTASESDTTNNTASVTSVVCDMAGSIKQVHARHVMPGDVLTYTIRLSASQRFGGGMHGEWVNLTDTLPFSHQVRFLGWLGALTGTQHEGHELRWQGRVRAGEALSLQYRLGVEGTVTPGTVLSNVVHLAWRSHQMRLGPVTTVVTLPHGMLGLGPGEGGQLRHSYGVTLEVPPGAVTDTTRFQLRPLFTDTHPIAPAGGLMFAQRAFEMNAFRFAESVHQFKRPLTITVGYTDAHAAGLRRETLRLWTREGPAGPWRQLGEPARVMSGALSFTTTHFSQFALFGEAGHQVFLPLTTR